MDKLSHVKNITNWDYGNGLKVDLVELKDGRVLGITNTYIVLHKNIKNATAVGEHSEPGLKIRL